MCGDLHLLRASLIARPMLPSPWTIPRTVSLTETLSVSRSRPERCIPPWSWNPDRCRPFRNSTREMVPLPFTSMRLNMSFILLDLEKKEGKRQFFKKATVNKAQKRQGDWR